MNLSISHLARRNHPLPATPTVRTIGLFVICVAAALFIVDPTSANPPVAVGAEFQVSDDFEQVQDKVRAAAAANGEFVVVWESGFDSDGDNYAIFGRRFDADGAALGASFLVNSYTTHLQVFPDVVRRDSGEFTVLWQSYQQDGDGIGLFAQRFNAAAEPLGVELSVNAETAGDQHDASIALSDDGGFLVVWDHDAAADHQIRARRFDADGVAVGGDLILSDQPAMDEFDPRVALRDGGFLAAWERSGGDGSGKAVFARFLNSDGSPQGDAFQVNGFTTWDQENPELAVADDGSFAVVWESQKIDDSGEAVAVKFFHSDGTPRTGDVRVNESTENDQRHPTIATTAGDEFLIVWESEDAPAEGVEVLGRRYDAMGKALSGEFQVNELSDGGQFYAHVADAGGRFIVSWTSDDCSDCFEQTKARLFVVQIFADGFETGDASGWSSTVP